MGWSSTLENICERCNSALLEQQEQQDRWTEERHERFREEEARGKAKEMSPRKP